VEALQQAAVAQVVEILADGLRRDVEARRQILDADLPSGARQRDDVILSRRPGFHHACL
jgi:hypothetical protein